MLVLGEDRIVRLEAVLGEVLLAFLTGDLDVELNDVSRNAERQATLTGRDTPSRTRGLPMETMSGEDIAAGGGCAWV